jgi:hypothetical protein
MPVAADYLHPAPLKIVAAQISKPAKQAGHRFPA